MELKAPKDGCILEPGSGFGSLDCRFTQDLYWVHSGTCGVQSLSFLTSYECGVKDPEVLTLVPIVTVPQ